MRAAFARGKWSPALAAFLLAAAACSPQCGTRATPVAATSPASSPAPSPSPTPTAPLQISAASFHAGEVGLAYNTVKSSASGGLVPYTWTVASGALPAGLILNADGSVSGTPTAAGTYSFTLQVADGGGNAATATATVIVAPALAVTLLPSCARDCAVELGCITACGAFGEASGGLGPYTYSLAGGVLPAGTSLSGLGLAGTFTGLTGYLKFTVEVTDALGAAATITPTFWMYPHVSLSGGAIGTANSPCFWTGYQSSPGCSVNLTYSGGTPTAGTPSVAASWASYSATCYPGPPPCPAPPLPLVSVSGGQVTVSVPSGGPTWINGYTGVLTVVLTNQDVCSAGPSRCSASATVNIRQLGG